MNRIYLQVTPIRRLIICVFLVLTTSVGAVDLDSLLTQSIGGRDGLDSVRAMDSYVARGRAFLNDLEGTFESCFLAPNKTYLKLETSLFTLIQAFDGQTAWQQDHAGQVTEMHGMERAEIMNGLYFDSFSHLIPGRIEGGRWYAGQDTVDGKPCHRVEHSPLHQDTITVYYDQATGYPILSHQTLDELPAETRFSDFRSVGGIMWPFHSSMTTVGAPLQIDFEYQEILVNQPVDPDLFCMKTITVINFSFPDNVKQTLVPAKYVGGHLYVEVRFGQRTVWMILDSGASATMIDQALVRQLGLKTKGSLPAKGMGGYIEIELFRIDSMRVGELEIYDVVVGAVELSNLAGALDEDLEFGGVLGYDFLSRFPILIDYQSPRITVFRPGDFRPPTGGAEIPFHLTLQVPTIRASLAGVVGNFIIDLGNPFGLLVHHRFTAANRLDTLLSNVEPLGMTVGGVGGQVDGRSALASSFSLGEVVLTSLRVILMDEQAGLAASTELDGNIGNLILEGFRVLFDYPGSRLVLLPTDK